MIPLRKILRSKALIICVAVVACYTLAGFFLAPWLVRHYVPKISQEQLKRRASIGEVRINPYTFTVEANDFSMQEPDGQALLGFKKLLVDFELKSIIEWAWTFSQISLQGPLVNAVIAKDGAINLAELAPISEEPPDLTEKNKDPLPLVVEKLSIHQGRIDFTDQRQSKPASITLEPLQLQINNLSTLRGQEGPKSITATLGDGGEVKWTGEIGLNPLVTKGSFSIENAQISTAWNFITDAVNLQQPTGKTNITVDYSLNLAGEEPQFQLANLAVDLTDISLKLKGAKEPFLELPKVRAKDGRFDLSERRVDIGEIAVKGKRLNITVDEAERLNVSQIVKDAGAKPSSADQPTAGRRNEAKPWKITLGGLDADGLALGFQNLSRDPAIGASIGSLKVRLKAEAEDGDPIKLRVSDVAVGASDVKAGFIGTADPVMRVDTVGLKEGVYELLANRLTAASVTVEGGHIDVQRQADDVVNLALLIAPPKRGVIAEKIVEAAAEAAAEGRPFQFMVKNVSLSGLHATYSDLAVQPGGKILNLENIAMSLSNVDGKSPMNFDASLKVREGGQLKAGGTVDPSGPAVESELQVAELGLTAFQPYVKKVAAIDLTSGSFSTKGKVRHGIKAAGAQTAYQGGFKLDNLRITETGGKETLLGWKSVQTEQLTVQLDPNLLEIGDLKITQPNGKFIIEKDRTINIAKVVKSEPPGKKAKPPAKALPAESDDAFSYRVRRILVSDGKVDFADLSLPTPFGTKIHELKGVVAGVSSDRNSRAQIKLDGHVDQYGTAKVDGELNTSDPKAFTNVNAVFRNVEMPKLSPYSGKFAGRKIDSGKLSADLSYKISKSQLAGDNKFVVERLTLGEKVKSPEAVDLPLDLAIALLEDSNGVIDLGLPVRGNLDSPEFSYGALVWKALTNLITKIVTSPFRALGAILPGAGEGFEFNSIAFEAGRPDVPPPEKEKLSVLAGGLQKRPQLKLSVQGRYNPVTDRAELQSTAVRRALASRIGQKPDPAEDPGPVDFSSPETGKAIESMFLERFGPDALRTLKVEQKTRKEAGTTSDGAPRSSDEDPGRLSKELFNRLVEKEAVKTTDLAMLADARAKAIVAELSGPGRVPGERILIKASAVDDKKDSATAVLGLETGR